MASEQLSPLTPSPAEIAMTVIGVVTIVGPLLGYWLIVRARTKAVAAAS